MPALGYDNLIKYVYQPLSPHPPFYDGAMRLDGVLKNLYTQVQAGGSLQKSCTKHENHRVCAVWWWNGSSGCATARILLL